MNNVGFKKNHNIMYICPHAYVLERKDLAVCEMQTAYLPLPENCCERDFFPPFPVRVR